MQRLLPTRGAAPTIDVQDGATMVAGRPRLLAVRRGPGLAESIERKAEGTGSEQPVAGRRVSILPMRAGSQAFAAPVAARDEHEVAPSAPSRRGLLPVRHGSHDGLQVRTKARAAETSGQEGAGRSRLLARVQTAMSSGAEEGAAALAPSWPARKAAPVASGGRKRTQFTALGRQAAQVHAHVGEGADPRESEGTGPVEGGPGPVLEGPWKGVSGEARRATMAAFAARRAASLSSQPIAGFRTARARDEAWLELAIDKLLPRLPRCVFDLLVDARGSEGRMGASAEERLQLARDALREVSDEKGLFLREVDATLHYFNAYAKERGWGEAFPWPCEASTLAMMVKGEQARGREAGRGSRGGETTGRGFCDKVVAMATRLAFPIDYDHPMVWGAAPAAGAGGGRRSTAATAPPQLSLQVMREARSTQPSVKRFMARSAVFTEMTAGRMQDAERVELMEDEEEGTAVMRGRAYLAKDRRRPLELWAYPMDYLGPIDWWPEHLQEAKGLAGGVAFPRWAGGHGSRTNLAKATALLPEASEKSEIRSAVYSLEAAAAVLRRRGAARGGGGGAHAARVNVGPGRRDW